jgi:hypothetical protein
MPLSALDVKALVAIGALTVLEIFALMSGIDGQLFSLVVAAIAGLGGFVIGSEAALITLRKLGERFLEDHEFRPRSR